MPKVVVYVRAEDARVIESVEGYEIDEWVRMLVRDQIARFHEKRALRLGAQQMPDAWAKRQGELEEGA